MTTAADEKQKGRVLLPSDILPTRYDLKLSPDLINFTFSGEVIVSLESNGNVGPDCKEIFMHAKELCFSSATLTIDGKGDQPPMQAEEIRVNTNKLKETVTFVFTESIPPSSTLKLKIMYTGFINNEMAGFYRSSYTDIHGNSKIMASTQFEALDARRAFPCWDEPARKAVFGLTLVIPTELHCFSNMPESSMRSLSGGKLKKVQYLDSPKMSTYLLAFCVGEFDYVQALTQHGVLIRVYTPPGKSETGLFALDCAVKSLDHYDDFFGMPYPLPKLDMVAIPEFAMGAMENWGLVTYREVDLLIDPQKASSSQKQRVCTVVTHELAHQWFGNLVTMSWWDDLWLNEGFASWAENWAADKIFPEWSMWDQFTTGHLATAMRLDSLKSSHPIQVPIHHATEVEEVFDAISYCKGGSVVRMIRSVLGMKHFQTGLANYMKRHAYGNTETHNLWTAWEETSGLPVSEMMASWTEQMGFPIVRVAKEEWSDHQVTLELEQLWFLSDGSDLTEAETRKTWTIPIMTCTEEGTQAEIYFMREKTAKMTVLISNKDGWVKLNAGQAVPMRIVPTTTMLSRLSDGINTKKLSECDRAGLLNDGYALVKAGHMQPETLIRLLSNYSHESSYIVWQGLSDVLGGLNTVLSDNEQISAYFKKFARGIVLPLMKEVGWEASDEDGHLTTLLRSIMINLLSTFCSDDEEVAQEAKGRFAKFMEDPNDVESLPSDLKTPVFKIVLKEGGEAEYQAVKAYFYSATDNAERKHVLASLGFSKDSSLKKQTMDWTTSGEVKVQDFFYAMGSVGRSSKEGREISWKFFQDNFEQIKGLIGKGSPSLMSACIVSCAGGFCSNEKADEIDAFFETNALPSNARKIAQLTEGMRTNAKFLAMLEASELSKEDFWQSL